MADNGCAPSVFPTYENDSSIENSRSLISLPNNTSVLGGESNGEEGGGYMMISLPEQTTTNYNQVPTPPSQPSPQHIMTNPTLPEEDLTTPPPSKKSRGRPRGSKNKTKTPTIINEASENIPKPINIEIPPGNDVIELLLKFSHRHDISLVVLGASGTVSDILICNPATNNGSFLPYRGLYKIVSLSGTYINFCFPNSSVTANNPNCHKNFVIHFTRAQGEIFGGIVAGKVMAVSPVVVMCLMFKNLEYNNVPYIDGRVLVETGGGESSMNPIRTMVRNNNVIISHMTSYADVPINSSTQQNRQLPQHPPTDVMRWNHTTNPNGY